MDYDGILPGRPTWRMNASQRELGFPLLANLVHEGHAKFLLLLAAGTPSGMCRKLAARRTG